MKARIYTKTGDKGETSLVGGSRVSKSDGRLEAYGTVDELNSFVGVLRAELYSVSDASLRSVIDTRLSEIQNNLFNIGSHLACETPALLAKLPGLSADLDRQLEIDMDDWESTLPLLRQFILPGGTKSAAAAHVCRTVCRRAERLVVGLRTREGDAAAGTSPVVFLNRLSDWFFLLARRLNSAAGVTDVVWSKG